MEISSVFNIRISADKGMHRYLDRIIKHRSANLFFFFFLMATPLAYGSSQARGWNGAAAAGLHHSHSNAGCEPYPRQLVATPDA